MNNMHDFTKELIKLQKRTLQVIENAPNTLGRLAVDDIRQNFKRQGVLTDSGLIRWKPSKAAIREKRRTLVKSGALMGSITYERRGNKVLVGVDLNAVVYAKRHNEGLRKMPKRQFIYLRKAVIREAIADLDHSIKKLG